jgi:ribosomal protein RSM22 (predicted rRNA methylase)
LRSLALELGGTRLRNARYELGPARKLLADAQPADLVVASYMVGEIDEAERTALTGLMWEKTREVLVVVEPGTPAGYARIMVLRAQLIAAGGYVAAPCPHDKECPLQAPDWCHFSQRLSRSRAHMQVKGAEVPFEDERFSYVVLTRTPIATHPSRVLAQPEVGKAEVTAKLCTPNGLSIAKVPRRAKADYARARRWRWGDPVTEA